mmetsp:Transcript_14693/g.43528  ORF Transcript_14693/g.43528 Transcript_14693/m.43528 type:complete len:467 (-) Transcript_14693:330-1730(-)
MLELPVSDDDAVLAQESDMAAVVAPDNVLDARHLELGEHLPRVRVEQGHAILRRQQHPTRGPREEHAICAGIRRRQLLGHLVLEVLEQDLPVLVQHSKAVASDEHGGEAVAAMRAAGLRRVASLRVERQELIGPTIHVRAHEHTAFCRGAERVVGEGPRSTSNGARARVTTATKGHHRHVATRSKLVHAKVFVLDVEHAGTADVIGGPLPLQLEDDHAGVMASGQEVLLRVRSEDPEPVVLSAEGLNAHAPGNVPHANGSVFRVGDDELVLWMKDHARHIVGVAPERVHFPRLGFVHSPEFDLTVVGSRHDQRKSGMEGSPVHSSVVALQDVLDQSVCRTEEVRIHARDHRVRATLKARRPSDVLLPQVRCVPDTHGLVEGSRNDQVILRVESSAHDVVVVPRQHRQAGPRLPVPDPDGLVIGRRHNPGVLVVELDCPDVVEVPKQREPAAPQLVIPHLDLVVIAA